MWGLCIVCIVYFFPLLFTYSEALKRSYDEPYTVAIAAPRLCRVLTVLKTTVVLSDGSVVHSDSSLNFRVSNICESVLKKKRMVIRVCATRMTIPFGIG